MARRESAYFGLIVIQVGSATLVESWNMLARVGYFLGVSVFTAVAVIPISVLVAVWLVAAVALGVEAVVLVLAF